MISRASVRIVIVEDQISIRNDLKILLQGHAGFVIVGIAGSVHEALVVIPATEPDLLFMDVQLGDGTGFDILEKLQPQNYKVIFLTAYQEHAIRAIKFGAFDYLLKPINSEELSESLTKVSNSLALSSARIDIAFKHFNTELSDRIVIHAQEYYQIVELADIIYCKGESGYTTFYLRNGKKILASKHLKEYEELLPSSIFLRPHQSYLVNRNYIEKFHTKGYIVLKEGTQIPVSFRRRHFVTSFFK